MNKYIFEIGNFKLEWYSALIIVAAMIGITMVLKEAKRYKYPTEFVFNMIFWAIIFGIIGARAYYVLFNLELYDSFWEACKIWEGGLAIHGGIIAGVLVILLYCKKYKVRSIRMFDFLAPAMLLAQAIGRWGNFFNGEAYGPVTTLDFLTKLHIPDFIIKNMYINGVYHQPTFLYESVWCIIGFVILLTIRRMKYIKIGQITGIYFIWYGIGRFLIESLRTDSLMLGNLKMAQIISIIMVLTGIVLIILFQKNSVFKNQYNDKENTNDINF